MSNRSGSENRYRSCQVTVRLTDEENAILERLAERTGGTRPQLLRESFFAGPLAQIDLGP